MVRCPVCGAEFEEDTALEMGAVVEDVDGLRLYFCSRHCRDEFFREMGASADGRAGGRAEDANGPSRAKGPVR